MAKRSIRAQSRVAREAVQLLGAAIKAHRLDRRVTAQELADRAGVSRDLVSRAERGDASCSVGAMFELAVLMEVPLFDDVSGRRVPEALDRYRRELTLLPRAARRVAHTVNDDF